MMELPENYKKSNENKISTQEYEKLFERDEKHNVELKKYEYNKEKYIPPYPLYFEKKSDLLCHSYYKDIPIRTNKY